MNWHELAWQIWYTLSTSKMLPCAQVHDKSKESLQLLHTDIVQPWRLMKFADLMYMTKFNIIMSATKALKNLQVFQDLSYNELVLCNQWEDELIFGEHADSQPIHFSPLQRQKKREEYCYKHQVQAITGQFLWVIIFIPLNITSTTSTSPTGNCHYTLLTTLVTELGDINKLIPLHPKWAVPYRRDWHCYLPQQWWPDNWCQNHCLFLQIPQNFPIWDWRRCRPWKVPKSQIPPPFFSQLLYFPTFLM